MKSQQYKFVKELSESRLYRATQGFKAYNQDDSRENP